MLTKRYVGSGKEIVASDCSTMVRLYFLFLKAAVSAICTPPQPGDESYETFIKVLPKIVSVTFYNNCLSNFLRADWLIFIISTSTQMDGLKWIKF